MASSIRGDRIPTRAQKQILLNKLAARWGIPAGRLQPVIRDSDNSITALQLTEALAAYAAAFRRR